MSSPSTCFQRRTVLEQAACLREAQRRSPSTMYCGRPTVVGRFHLARNMPTRSRWLRLASSSGPAATSDTGMGHRRFFGVCLPLLLVHTGSGKRPRRQRHAIVNSAGVFAVSTDQPHRRYDMASLVSTSLAIALLPGKGRSPSI